MGDFLVDIKSVYILQIQSRKTVKIVVINAY